MKVKTIVKFLNHPKPGAFWVKSDPNPARAQKSNDLRRAMVNPIFLVTIVVVGGLVGCYFLLQRPDAKHAAVSSSTNELRHPTQADSADDHGLFPVIIRKPSGPPRVDTGLIDKNGAPMTVACSTCHATRPPNSDNKLASDLDEFHKSMHVSHGTISCLSCHNSTDYDSLKLADGTRVEFSNVMTLCAQCHGPQMNDYLHGAHGGMNGYWDKSRGPQTKNNCIDCHNPHSPQLPKMRPTFKPRDRFLKPISSEDDQH